MEEGLTAAGSWRARVLAVSTIGWGGGRGDGAWEQPPGFDGLVRRGPRGTVQVTAEHAGWTALPAILTVSENRGDGFVGRGETGNGGPLLMKTWMKAAGWGSGQEGKGDP